MVASYFVVSFVIYTVLTKLAQMGGRQIAGIKIVTVMLALLWPLWEEFAVVGIILFALYRGTQVLNTPQAMRK